MKELRAERGAKVAIAHEAVEGKRGHLAVRVFSSDAEQGGGGEVDRVVRAIEAGLPQVTELTKRDFARRRAVSSCACWSVILVLGSNYFTHWLF